MNRMELKLTRAQSGAGGERLAARAPAGGKGTPLPKLALSAPLNNAF